MHALSHQESPVTPPVWIAFVGGSDCDVWCHQAACKIARRFGIPITIANVIVGAAGIGGAPR